MTPRRSRKFWFSLALAVSLSACAAPGQRVSAEAEPVAQSAVPLQRLIEAGNSVLEKELYKEALQFFAQALQQDPASAEAKLGVAEAYLGSGSTSAAFEAFSMLADQGTSRASVLQGKGISLLQMGKRDEALPILVTAVREDPSLWRAWNALGRGHDLKRQWDEASRAYEAALKTRPGAHIVLNNWGMSLLAQSRFVDAEAKFSAALAARPDSDVTRNNLRFAFALQGKYRDAFTDATRQDMAVVLNNVGYAALLRGDRDRAKTYFVRAMEQSPHFFSVAHENLRKAEGPSESIE